MDEKQKRNVLSALSLTKHWIYLLTASMLTLAPMGAAAGNVESKSENTVQAVQQAKKTVTGRLWLKLGSDNKSLKYQYFGEGQKMGAYYVCGISIVASSSPEASSFTATYDNIYQANYNGSNSESMYFLKN